MRILRRLFWAMLAGASSTLTQPVLADAIYDGMTWPTFKTILTSTSLTLTEKVTEKGNRYFIASVPGTTISFLATTADCDQGQTACDGFAYMYLNSRPMETAAMGEFNLGMHFVKARPSASGASTAIVGEFYARGVTDAYVRNAGALFTAAIATYLSDKPVASMSGPNPPPSFSFASPMSSEKYFSELAQKSGPKPPMAGERNAAVDAALVDSVHDRRR